MTRIERAVGRLEGGVQSRAVGVVEPAAGIERQQRHNVRTLRVPALCGAGTGGR